VGYYVEIRVVNEISSHSESSGLPPFALVGQVKPTELARFLKGKDKDKDKEKTKEPKGDDQ